MCMCTANLFLEEALKCSPTSCFRYTVLSNDVQSPIYLDESTRLAPLSKLPCSPWIFQDECQGYGLWETFCIQFCHNSLWESKAAAHNFQPCHYPGSHKQLQPNCSKQFSASFSAAWKTRDILWSSRSPVQRRYQPWPLPRTALEKELGATWKLLTPCQEQWQIAWWGLTWCAVVTSASYEVLSVAPTWRCSSPQRTWSVVAIPSCDSAL